MNIITVAFDMYAAVEKFAAKAQRFYYLVVLFGCRCPKCNRALTMITEGRCRCSSCKCEFDPTVAFQRCSKCGGRPVLRVRRYQCEKCGMEIISKFLFKGVVFDAGYFCQRMAESRKRKKQRAQRVREMLAQCRSEPLALEAPDLNSVSGLIDALNGLTQGIDEKTLLELKSKFDLGRYQEHICQYINDEPINLRDIPAIIENTKLDLIWSFVAIIFLEHQFLVDIKQDGENIWVRKHVDRQGQDFSGEAEGINGIERFTC